MKFTIVTERVSKKYKIVVLVSALHKGRRLKNKALSLFNPVEQMNTKFCQEQAYNLR